MRQIGQGVPELWSDIQINLLTSVIRIDENVLAGYKIMQWKVLVYYILDNFSFSWGLRYLVGVSGMSKEDSVIFTASYFFVKPLNAHTTYSQDTE